MTAWHFISYAQWNQHRPETQAAISYQAGEHHMINFASKPKLMACINGKNTFCDNTHLLTTDLQMKYIILSELLNNYQIV